MTNWIADRNPFKLEPPPAWWLKRLADQDAALRVFPAITNYCYIVGRWSKNAQHFRFLTRVASFRDNRAEAQRLLQHQCVFVKSLTVFDVKNDNFFVWLRLHDSWNPQYRPARSVESSDPLEIAIEHTIAAIEAAEDEAERRLDAQITDEALMRGSSAYTALLLRRGNMTFVQHGMESN